LKHGKNKSLKINKIEIDKKMRCEKKEKKIFSKIFLILIVLTFVTLIIISFPQVKAVEQEGCCLDTGSQQCVTTTRQECSSRFFTGPPYDCSNVPECKPGTCIPKEKGMPCLRNKQLAECLAIDGVPDIKQLEEIPQCKPGCCIIAKGLKAEVLQYRQCEDLATTLGFKISDIEFKDSITNQVECKKEGSPSDLGCCVLGSGSCTYGLRADCQANFIPLAGDMFCRDVSSCALTTHYDTDCGKLVGTETDIYWYDSQGNQEDVFQSCEYPTALCTKNSVGKAECKPTSCNLTLEGDQKMTVDSPKVEKNTKNTGNQLLLTGTSICYNFYTQYGDSRMYNRSTGLQNQVLHCDLGSITKEGLGTDRQKLCFPAESSVQGESAAYHANVKENNWKNCSQCGLATGFLSGPRNLVGDFFMANVGLPGGAVLSGLGAYCTKDTCESGDYGDCVYHLDYGAGFLGLGGKSTVNGTFSFMGSAPIGSCDSKYPPGGSSSQCSSCGTGGDFVWNRCTEKECYSKGDCTFKSLSPWGTAVDWIIMTIGLTWAERTSLIVPDCLTSFLIPPHENFFTCIGDRFGTYTIGTPASVVSKVTGFLWNNLIVKGLLKGLEDAGKGIISDFGGGG
jgi:hypothetical protein